MKSYELNAGWRLLEAPLDWGAEALSRVLATQEGWMDCRLPCDVHTPLEAAGHIRDVVRADYSFEAEWVEKRSWWFVRGFRGEELDGAADAVELVFDSLDAHADVFLNGEYLGAHDSAHYPFAAGIRGRVRPGENILALRLTSGLEQVSDADLAELNWAVCHEESNGCPERGDRRRAFVRKPTYCVGWDWGPKAITCGIVKGARVNSYRKTAIRGAQLRTLFIDGGTARLRLTLEIDQLHPYATRDASIKVSLSLNGERAAEAELADQLLGSGVNYVDMDLDLPDARLWWPHGYGEQPLYDADIRVLCEGETEIYPVFRFGVRTVSLDSSRLRGAFRNFFLVVNGVRIFCKGADWIPADSIYARVTGEKYETLVAEAAEAGFNMLRIWGGGIYETDVFYEACDKNGILIWHDFMFGCSSYPDHREAFRRLVEKEMDYQTKRLRNHACLALWCGNNENHWIFNPEDNPKWNIDLNYEKQFGLYTSNRTAKDIIRFNCPEIPYWNSSPYGGKLPNDDTVGDIHHWHACMMNPDMAKRIDPAEYDKVNARFVSEYGYPGPCAIESIREYLDGREIDRNSRVWDLHNNTFEKRTVNAGIEKHYGVDAAKLSLEDYLLYAGLTQSLMLEYSLEALRFKEECGGALFWMYDDTWGEVGWTIIDYYLRRKISYYGVRRAFAPVKLTLRRTESGCARLMGANDTPNEMLFNAELGYLSFDGSVRLTEKKRFTLPARSRLCLGEFTLPEADYTAGVFAVIPEGDAPQPAVLRLMDTAALKIGGGEPTVIKSVRDGEDWVITLSAQRYLHGVHAAGAARFTDNYFDLLPGQVKTLRARGADAEPVFTAVR